MTAPLLLPQAQVSGGSQFGGLTYQVHVLGEVGSPGTYRVAASTRLSEILKIAGISGSERRIEIRRKEGGSRVVDLFSYKFRGLLDANPYLMDNDVVFVPLREKVVQIAGTVKRPGLYELKNEKTIQEIVDLAGGFTPGVANPTPIKVIRFSHDKKEVLEVPNVRESRAGFEVKNADVIIIPHILTERTKFDYNLASLPGDGSLFFPSYEERVFVIGAVAKPGPYSYSPYYDLRQYLTIAGGATKLAKPERTWRVIMTDGKKKRGEYDTSVNPGDTIVIPERYLPPESWLSLVLGTSSAVLGITTTVLTLTR